ncbi:MAG: LysR substrate-binding domain-containing protein [Flavobacteriales bacterium]|nr:LysR substrate-binding domain-containing protein [Flavobacteriales bacterium]
MTLQQLEYVIALDNYKHFVKAAEHCLVSQPNLTIQLKKLEDEIGIKIFDRDSKPLKTTTAGEQFLIKVRQIIREVNELKEFVSTEKESIAGEFTLGIIPTLAPYLLPKFLPHFVKNNPNTFLNIKELTTDQIIDQLNRGTLDMGILATPLNVNSIREIPLFYEPFILYLPDDHPYKKEKEMSAAKLEMDDLLLLTEGHCFREQALQLCRNQETEEKKEFNFQSGSIEALKGLVKQKMGYTLIPELSVNAEVDNDYTLRFSAPEPVREVSIVVHNSFPKEALIEHLRNEVQDALPEYLEKARRAMRVKWR